MRLHIKRRSLSLNKKSLPIKRREQPQHPLSGKKSIWYKKADKIEEYCLKQSMPVYEKAGCFLSFFTSLHCELISYVLFTLFARKVSRHSSVNVVNKPSEMATTNSLTPIAVGEDKKERRRPHWECNSNSCNQVSRHPYQQSYLRISLLALVSESTDFIAQKWVKRVFVKNCEAWYT